MEGLQDFWRMLLSGNWDIFSILYIFGKEDSVKINELSLQN